MSRERKPGETQPSPIPIPPIRWNIRAPSVQPQMAKAPGARPRVAPPAVRWPAPSPAVQMAEGKGWRKSQVLGKKGAGTTVVEGHGEIEGSRPTFRVPDWATIIIFQGMGVGLDDSHGVDIASGKGTQVQLPLLYDAANREYDTELPTTGGVKVAGSGSRQTYRPGELCPNLKLFPWNHPGMGVLNVQDNSYKIGYDASHPHNFERLEDIAEKLDGMIQWAACTVFRG